MLARSGGTLVCRCLGSMNGVVVLSEIHPLAVHLMNPVAQARVWFGLLSVEDCARGTISFADAIELIARRCDVRGKHLVIREWSHWDYIGVPFVPGPRYRSLLVDMLRERFGVRSTALVRHPVDMWLNLRELSLVHSALTLDVYLEGYRRFAELCTRTGFMRYEDFVRAPQDQLASLCRSLELDFDPGFAERWLDYEHYTGHKGGARGSRVREIRPLPSREMELRLLDDFERNSNYGEILGLLGYVPIPRS
jgi:hypothetical protein